MYVAPARRKNVSTAMVEVVIEVSMVVEVDVEVQVVVVIVVDMDEYVKVVVVIVVLLCVETMAWSRRSVCKSSNNAKEPQRKSHRCGQSNQEPK